MRYSFNGVYPVTRKFGVFDAAYSRYPGSTHPGVDYGVPANTPLFAGMSGKAQVYLSSAKTGRGNEVWITDGIYSRRVTHMNRVDVHSGQWVAEGQPIGLSGHTGYVVDSQGRVGTPGGAHVHEELLINGQYVDITKHVEEDMFNGKTAQEWAKIANDVTNIANIRLAREKRYAATVSVPEADADSDKGVLQVEANVKTMAKRIDDLTKIVSSEGNAAVKLEQIKKVIGG